MVATLYAFNSWGDTRVIPRTIPRAWVVPIFLVMDQTMHTGRKWNTASPISHRKLLIPAQNTDIWVSVLVPPSNRAISPMILRNPRIRPPTMIVGTLHKKPYIGDDDRQIQPADIRRANRLMFFAEGMMVLGLAVLIMIL